MMENDKQGKGGSMIDIKKAIDEVLKSVRDDVEEKVKLNKKVIKVSKSDIPYPECMISEHMEKRLCEKLIDAGQDISEFLYKWRELEYLWDVGRITMRIECGLDENDVETPFIYANWKRLPRNDDDMDYLVADAAMGKITSLVRGYDGFSVRFAGISDFRNKIIEYMHGNIDIKELLGDDGAY